VPAHTHAHHMWQDTAFSDADKVYAAVCLVGRSVSRLQTAKGPGELCSTHRRRLEWFGFASCQLPQTLRRLHCCGQLLHHLLLPLLLQRPQLPLQLSQRPLLGAAAAGGSVCRV
jgi:hypothetical protein